MSLLPRSNFSEKLYVVAATKPGWSFELEHAADGLDDAITAYILDRDGEGKCYALLCAWGHAHSMYLEASGAVLKAD